MISVPGRMTRLSENANEFVGWASPTNLKTRRLPTRAVGNGLCAVPERDPDVHRDSLQNATGQYALNRKAMIENVANALFLRSAIHG